MTEYQLSNEAYDALEKFSNDGEGTDVFLYCGDIRNGYDEKVINECSKRVNSKKQRKNVLLILYTYGGSPDSAYRIAKCFQKAYKTKEKHDSNTAPKFSILIDGYCKSAGTIICLGADELIMSGNGQLGPLDVQVLKKDEMLERQSGLAPIQAIEYLNERSIQYCRDCFADILTNFNFSAKTSIKVAIELVSNTLKPVYSQLDPVTLAEAYRAIKIAHDYGSRLATENVKSDTVFKLVRQYPSHAFVIDRDEARDLFNNVLNLNQQNQNLLTFLEYVKIDLRGKTGERNPICEFLEKEESEKRIPSTNKSKHNKKEDSNE